MGFKNRRFPLQTKAAKGDPFLRLGEEEYNNGGEREE